MKTTSCSQEPHTAFMLPGLSRDDTRPRRADVSPLNALDTRLGSVEEFPQALATTGWETGFRQLQRGPGPVDLTALATRDSLLLQVHIHSKVHQLAIPPRESITFALINEPGRPFKFGQRFLESGTITCFDPHAGIDGVSESGFDAFTLSFDAEMLSEIAENTGLPDPGTTPEAWSIAREIDARGAASLNTVLKDIFKACQDDKAIPGANLQNFINIELPTEILRLWAAGTGIPAGNRSHRAPALKRALRNIAEQPRTAMTVAQLCEQSACSLSTLERAFREYFGVSPKQYLTAQRLSGVRSSLLDPADSRTISDVAAAWGFWHMSKFASDYKRMFGELPSRTRRIYSKRAA